MSEFKGFEDLHDLPEAADCKESTSQFSESIGEVAIPGFVEDCPKCRGSGVYMGRSQHGSRCFKCKGKGTLSFKTSPAARGKARKYAAKSKTRKAENNAAKFQDWLKEHGMADWFEANKGNDFATSLYAGGMKYGQLTEGQAKAVYNAMARDEDGKAGFEEWCKAYPGVLEWLQTETKSGNEFAGSLLSKGIRFGTLTDGQLNAVMRNVEENKQTGGPESALDVSGLKGYFAVPNGDTRLKLCVRKPGKNSRWYGWTFVDDGAEYGSRRTYGKQAPDGLYKGSVVEELTTILKDPLAAQVAYGKLTGSCGHCGRMLEDEKSVAAGIGPICAAKYS